MEEEKKKIVMLKLKEPNPKQATFSYNGKKQKVRRPKIGSKSFILANEIYSVKSNNMTEQETIKILNKMEKEGTIETRFINNWVWYCSKA